MAHSTQHKTVCDVYAQTPGDSIRRALLIMSRADNPERLLGTTTLLITSMWVDRPDKDTLKLATHTDPLLTMSMHNAPAKVGYCKVETVDTATPTDGYDKQIPAPEGGEQ